MLVNQSFHAGEYERCNVIAVHNSAFQLVVPGGEVQSVYDARSVAVDSLCKLVGFALPKVRTLQKFPQIL